MKKRNYLKWILLGLSIAISGFIIVNSFISGDASTAESNTVVNSTASFINIFKPGAINETNKEGFIVLIRKVFGHFGLFGLSGFATTWTFYLFLKESKFSYFLHFGGLSLAVGLAIAWLSEAIQVFMPGRSGSASDILIDLAGYFIGVLLVIFILFLAKKPIFTKVIQEEKRAN